MPNMNRRQLLATAPAALATSTLWAQSPAPSAPFPPTGAAAAAAGAPKLEWIYDAIVDIEPAQLLGDAPLGERRMVPISGGTFEGPGLKGTVLAGGADRQLVRKDGIVQLDALYEMKTHDGAVITVHNQVLVDNKPPGGGPRYAFSHIKLTTPTGPYEWLNRKAYVGTLTSLRPQRQAVLIRCYQLA
ncbi:DUF3237 domain-containing protein [Curvibacter sp. CHRR-16]|uniref:DUF3237 domain-containing protein n=1 Tax=Curvibacter sp. CHRR-16 TaxID=2835872 RepID=UPI001BDAF366|nr:DUF3237 domain-containing protein [Curvibacter sp. CHRR-16]MBT0570544.1 DUF3237 domain-containing protein [Curvibacter sp. CHRR-16]